MKKRLLPLVPAVLLLCLAAGAIQAETFHVSPRGDDSQTGISPAEAWKTVERVNRQTFQPGDSILFQSGGMWHGQLRPQGSGAEGR